MKDGLRLGRIAGLPVAVHWSVLVVAWLLVWGLAEGILPDTAPGHASITYWVVGAIGALALLASLLAHEVAHAVVARQDGVEVEGLTLWLFGGVAKLRSQPVTARSELRIALVGPATSLMLAASFGLLGLGLDGIGTSSAVVALVAWLAAVNLLLGIFNLLPGAPLDGGRVLKAMLWLHHGDRNRASLSAARAGAVVGYVLVWLGVAEMVLLTSLGGVWLVLIGWFVVGASLAERADVKLRQALGDVSVGAVMREPHTVPAGSSVAEVLSHDLCSQPQGVFPVEAADGRVVGLVAMRRLRRVPADDVGRTTVGSVMVPLAEVPTAVPDERLVTALEHAGQTESERSRGRIVVLDHGRLVGLVTPADVDRTVDARTHEVAS